MSYSVPPALASGLGSSIMLGSISWPGKELPSKVSESRLCGVKETAGMARLSVAAWTLGPALLGGNDCAELPTAPLSQLSLREKPKPFPRAIICQACVTVWHVKWPS